MLTYSGNQGAECSEECCLLSWPARLTASVPVDPIVHAFVQHLLLIAMSAFQARVVQVLLQGQGVERPDQSVW